MLLFSCKEECHDPANPACENYDACYGHNAVSADFTIWQGSGYYGYYQGGSWHYPTIPGFNMDEDSIWINTAFFNPKDSFPGTEYTWYIGTETLDVKSFYRTSFPVHSHVPVTLVATRNNDACLAPADRKDSITKSFYVLDQYYLGSGTDKPSWVGSYKGAYAIAPTYSFNFKLDYNFEIGDSISNFIYQGCTGQPVMGAISSSYRAAHIFNGFYFYPSMSPNATGACSCYCNGIFAKEVYWYLPEGSRILQAAYKNESDGQWYSMSARKLD